jgi:magnesium transporter
MARMIKKVSTTIGLPPGTVIHVGRKRVEKSRITVIDYDREHFEEKEVASVEECIPLRDKPTVTWINVDGIEESGVIERLGECHGVHPLVLEDVVNTSQRPKMEDLGDYLFLVVKMLYFDEEDRIVAEQVSLILGPNFVLSFQERPGDVFESIRNRIRNAKGRVREMAADYLAYALLDSIVDHYFIILERLGERIEAMEEELVDDPTPQTLQTIHTLKREMIFLRKSVWPLREEISGLVRADSPLIQESTAIYLRDVYDHTIQVIDTVETFRDMVSGMLDIYLSSVSNRMNEVMKVLTIIATIFIPLTFIAGIYGMNFQHMPELGWRFGYFGVLGIMALIFVLMVIYFKRRSWL